MQKYRDTVTDGAGNAILSSTITVTHKTGGGVATIYSDNGVTAKSNPFTASGVDGAYNFYAANGRYDITIAATGFDTEQHIDVRLFDSNSVKDFGALGDGTTDDRAYFVLADVGDFSVSSGTYSIQSNITITNDMVFEPGAIIKPASGITITINGAIQAGMWQIFDTSAGGSFAGSFKVKEVFPDWFSTMQAAVDYVVNNGMKMTCVTGKTYTLTSAITIDDVHNTALNFVERAWELDFNYANIVQDTDNTPIVKFTPSVTTNFKHWKICNLFGRWTNDQVAANTNAVCILFGVHASSTVNYHNSDIENVYNENGFRTISTVTTGSQIVNVWGVKFRRIYHDRTTSGAVIWIESPVATGMPNNHFEDIYNTSLQTAESEFYLKENSDFVILNHEANLITKRMLELNNCSGYQISARCERSTITDDEIILLTQSHGTIRNLNVLTVELPDGAAFIRGATSTSFGPNNIDSVLEFNTTITGGSGTIYVIAGLTGWPWVLKEIPKLNSTDLLAWEDTFLSNYITVLNDSIPRINWADNGDSDKTFTTGIDLPVQRFNTTLTANRTVTLPVASAFAGAEYKVIRDATTPGAFTLTIKRDGGANLVVMPANEKRVATFTYTQTTNWMLTGYSPAL